MKLFSVPALVLAMAAATHAATYVYVSVGGENRIAIYEQDKGKLTHVADQKVGGAPGSLGVDPKKERMYAALRSTKQVATFGIDLGTGRLKELGTIDVQGNLAFLATDRTGRFLLSASYSDGFAAIHRIGGNGLVQTAGAHYYPTKKNAHAILTDASNRYAFVPHTGPDKVYQFILDTEAGTLVPNDVPTLSTKPGTGPRHLAFHPALKSLVYFSNEQGSGITVCRLDAGKGTLRVAQTVSSLPEGYDGSNTCAQIKVTPDGKYVYVSNRGHDSIAGFAIDQKTGELSPIGRFPTEAVPRAIHVDPSGKFFYAAGQRSGKLAVYDIEKDGALKRTQTLEVGKSPSWIEPLSFE